VLEGVWLVIVIGLITTAEGCPVCVEVFPGNTQDASTVIEKVRELRTRHGLNKMPVILLLTSPVICA